MSRENEGKVEAELAEATSKFSRMETLLHSTEAELSAVKEDLFKLTTAKTNIMAPTNDREDQIMETNKILKKVLGKIFKQLKATFRTAEDAEIKDEDENSASNTTSGKTFSGDEVVELLAQHFREAIEYLNVRSNSDKEE